LGILNAVPSEAVYGVDRGPRRWFLTYYALAPPSTTRYRVARVFWPTGPTGRVAGSPLATNIISGSMFVPLGRPLGRKNLTEEEAWLLLFGAGSLPVSKRCPCRKPYANPVEAPVEGVLVRAGYLASAGPTTNVSK
jgi:hypothetical protein